MWVTTMFVAEYWSFPSSLPAKASEPCAIRTKKNQIPGDRFTDDKGHRHWDSMCERESVRACTHGLVDERCMLKPNSYHNLLMVILVVKASSESTHSVTRDDASSWGRKSAEKTPLNRFVRQVKHFLIDSI